MAYLVDPSLWPLLFRMRISNAGPDFFCWLLINSKNFGIY